VSDIAERALPHNLEAEKAVLGAVMLNNGLVDAASAIVQPPDFFRDAHQVIWRHVLRLSDRREAIDMVTLRESLHTAGHLDRIGGPAYISALLDGIPHSTNIEHYARIVREKATLRELIFSANKTLATAYASDEDAAKVLDQAQQDLYGIATHRQRGGFVHISEILRDEAYPAIEAAADKKSAVTGVPSGFTDLDEMTSGWQPGDLIIIAARPSMGKTALVLNMAQHEALTGYTVGVHSVEMARRQLAMRALMSEGRIDGHRLKTGFLGQSDYSRLSEAMSTLSEATLWIDDTSSVTLPEVRARARALQASAGLHLLVIDYVQLMEMPDGERRDLQIGVLSRGLKGLAKDLNIPIVILSQLSRKLEERGDKRPMLSDLRESGNLEQDADVVVFIYRDEVYNEQTADAGIAELIIAKQRNGPTGTVKVGFEKAHTRFFNLSTRAA
jgi:replicative DNA helicase